MSGDLTRLMKALSFAAVKHRDQRRKDHEASPYINHPIAVALLLHNEAGIDDPDVLCCALLHDTVEDTDATPEELEVEFGKIIRDLVMEVTDDKQLPKTERKRQQIERAARLSPKAKLVKLADKTCNLRDMATSPPTDWTQAQIGAYFHWAKQVVDPLRGTHPVLESQFDKAHKTRLQQTETI